MSSRSSPALPPTLLLISLKMYFTPPQTVQYLNSLLDPESQILRLTSTARQKLVLGLIPDFLCLFKCSDILTSTSASDTNPPLLLGAQDCATESSGAFTGEISAWHLSHIPHMTFVELGHAERRRLFHENDEITAQKAVAVVNAGLVPLVCIGELTAPNAADADESVDKAIREVAVQVKAVLEALVAVSSKESETQSQPTSLVFAYEPVWAIGAPKPASVPYIAGVVKGIKEVIRDVQNETGAKWDTRVIYGGSAGPGLWSGSQGGNGEGLGKYVDGMFLGRFAHKVEGVRGVVEEMVQSLS